MHIRKPDFPLVDGKAVDPNTIEVDGVDVTDHPDYVDAYPIYAEFFDGEALTEVQLESLLEGYPDLIQEAAYQEMVARYG